MFANRYTALIDACSLVSVWRRNLLLSLAEEEFFRVRWSPQILAETERTLTRLQADRGFADARERAARAIAGMTRAFPEALVEDFDRLLGNPVGLPDPDDEHVVAAALKTQAQAIVTENCARNWASCRLSCFRSPRCESCRHHAVLVHDGWRTKTWM